LVKEIRDKRQDTGEKGKKRIENRKKRREKELTENSILNNK